MKKHRACTANVDADLETLVWTRGRDFPIARLDSRMECIRCVMVVLEPPSVETRQCIRA